MEDKDALIERVARVLDIKGAFCGECYNEPGDFYDECSQCRRLLTGYAAAVVDAVVMPLVQERDRLAAEKAKWKAKWQAEGAVSALRQAAQGLNDRADRIEKGTDSDH